MTSTWRDDLFLVVSLTTFTLFAIRTVHNQLQHVRHLTQVRHAVPRPEDPVVDPSTADKLSLSTLATLTNGVPGGISDAYVFVPNPPYHSLTHVLHSAESILLCRCFRPPTYTFLLLDVASPDPAIHTPAISAMRYLLLHLPSADTFPPTSLRLPIFHAVITLLAHYLPSSPTSLATSSAPKYQLTPNPRPAYHMTHGRHPTEDKALYTILILFTFVVDQGYLPTSIAVKQALDAGLLSRYVSKVMYRIEAGDKLLGAVVATLDIDTRGERDMERIRDGWEARYRARSPEVSEEERRLRRRRRRREAMVMEDGDGRVVEVGRPTGLPARNWSWDLP